jgi:hypothetical protein
MLSFRARQMNISPRARILPTVRLALRNTAASSEKVQGSMSCVLSNEQWHVFRTEPFVGESKNWPKYKMVTPRTSQCEKERLQRAAGF